MPAQVYNNVSSTLFNSLDSASTTISVTDGGMFPSVADGDWYPIHVVRSNNAFEIMHVMGSDENGLLTVERAQEGTDPLTFESGSTVQIRLTKEALAKIDASEMTVTEQGTSDKRPLENWVSDLKDPEFIAEGGTEVRNASSHSGDNLSLRDFGAAGDGVTDDTGAITAALSSGRRINGLGRTYLATTKPATFSGLSNALIKVGTVYYPTRDYLRTDTAKITNGLMYTAWPQDKCYKVGTQLRMWANEKQAHTDATARIVLYISDDGGETYSSGEYLESTYSGKTLWCAGYDGAREYLIVRVPTGTADVPPYTYQTWSRLIEESPTADYNAGWNVTNTTFPMPASSGNPQPIMVHSFTTGHDGAIYVGGSLGDGTCIYRSDDNGATWSITVQFSDVGGYSEPTIRYVAGSGIYCGFLRHNQTNPAYWVSTDNLATFELFVAPDGFFGGGANSGTTVSFDVDSAGDIHAVVAYRNGVIEGSGTDDVASAFYLTGPSVDGNFWTQSGTVNYYLGALRRREKGGASAIGQGSVIVDGNKVHLYYGQEDRTGLVAGYQKGNRLSNVYQTVVFLDDLSGVYNTLADMAKDRSSGSPMRKVSGMDAFEIPFSDASGKSSALVSGRPNYAMCPNIITVSSGDLNLNEGRYAFYRIETEAGAATDTVETISDYDARPGDVVVFKTSSSSRDVTFVNGAGNIQCGQDRTLPNAQSSIAFMKDDAGFWGLFSYWVNA